MKMKDAEFDWPLIFKRIAVFLLLGLLFSLSYTQNPLYNSNQNSHMLRGLASAGYGFLSDDWLANTVDPFPVFSMLMVFSFKFLNENWFYIYQFLIYSAYFYAFAGIADHFFNLRKNKSLWWTFLALVIFLHSALASELFINSIGQDLGRVLHHGVALQYAINHNFQPSSFTVFLILAVYLFLKGRDYLAAFFIGLAGLIYFSVAIGGAFLIIGFLYVLVFREKKIKRAFLVGLIALILVLPIVIYVYLNFAPTDPVAYQEMQHLFFDIRFPHHANPADWGKDSFGKLALVITSLWLIRKSRVFPVLTISLGLVVLLTLVTIFTGNKSLGLLFPWRLSTVLVPIATAVLLAKGLDLLNRKKTEFFKTREKTIVISTSLLTAACVCWGIYSQVTLFQEQQSSPERGVIDFVKNNKKKGETYLTPHGFEGFRLATGAPIYISFKSHPYNDVDVVAWDRRVKELEGIFDRFQDLTDAELIKFMKEKSLTHVLFAKNTYLPHHSSFMLIYDDKFFSLFKMKE